MPWVVDIVPAEDNFGTKIVFVTVSVHPAREFALTEISPWTFNDRVKVTCPVELFLV